MEGLPTFACKSQECHWQDWYIYLLTMQQFQMWLQQLRTIHLQLATIMIVKLQQLETSCNMYTPIKNFGNLCFYEAT